MKLQKRALVRFSWCTSLRSRCPSQGASGAPHGHCAVVAKVCPPCEIARVYLDGEKKQRRKNGRRENIDTIKSCLSARGAGLPPLTRLVVSSVGCVVARGGVLLAGEECEASSSLGAVESCHVLALVIVASVRDGLGEASLVTVLVW